MTGSDLSKIFVLLSEQTGLKSDSVNSLSKPMLREEMLFVLFLVDWLSENESVFSRLV